MPTYQYACTNPDCGHEFDQVQSFTDAALTECPVCGQRLRKVYGSVGVVFKGSGFYRNDSRDAKVSTAPGASDGPKSAETGKGADKGSSSSESTGTSDKGGSDKSTSDKGGSGKSGSTSGSSDGAKTPASSSGSNGSSSGSGSSGGSGSGGSSKAAAK
ncbi:hypothetical protein BH10ACT8_BH10ACT8_04400 [soil metagenome]